MGSISGLKPLHSKHAIGVFLCPRNWKRLSTESPCGLQVATGVVGHCVDPVQHRKAPAFLGDFIYPHGGRRVVGWWGGGWWVVFLVGGGFSRREIPTIFFGKKRTNKQKFRFGRIYGDFSPGCVFLWELLFFGWWLCCLIHASEINLTARDQLILVVKSYSSQTIHVEYI